METAAIAPAKTGSKKKKIILISLGAAAAGVLGYFGWQWWHKHKAAKEEDGGDLPSPPSKDSFSSGSGSGNGFPLKKGSKGTKVKAVQKSLIAKYGKSILPKYGADGGFGNETIAALKKAGLPSEIDETTYNTIVPSLSGTEANHILTIEATYVWASPKEAVKVPANMLLGTEVEERNGYTLFENDGRPFLVKTKSVKNL